MSAMIGAIYLYINNPVVNMREYSSSASEVVSQAYFAEEVTIEEEFGEWIQIKTSDSYLGWIPKNVLDQVSERYETTLKTSRISAHIYSLKDTAYGPIITVPFGSRLKLLDESDSRWLKIALPNGKECFIQRGDVANELEIKDKSDLIRLSMDFLNLPYTWGGRSSFGFDCSGFVQMLYKQIGINLPRDSKDQVNDSRFKTISMEELEEGDLIFFGRTEQTIGHVGMYLGSEYFIHSTVRENKPWIRISRLTDLEWSGSPDVNYTYRTARQLIKE